MGAVKSAFAWNGSVQPIAQYPSSIVDSQGCEFGFEMYYHIGYAYHLHQQGLLKQTISCRDTECFYWFSPQHREKYKRRSWVADYPSISQRPHELPDFSRWDVPDFAARYANHVDFGFGLPLLLVFNKYNSEWGGPPVNYLSKEFLVQLSEWAAGRMQVVYFRPTVKIVADDSEVFNLREKSELIERGVVMAETLHDQYLHLSFNEFQLCLLSQSALRIAVQGGAAYMNALFPGQLSVLHRKGAEKEAGTYEAFRKMKVGEVCVYDNENELLEKICEDSVERGAA